ncbi:phage tail protein [Volucribacter amazonae]|uniref:Phage tail protein n=1 Tax=Volucribacter amazonae TaxID=256731 RepID=A0A9X4PAB9_9PAST|nr:phage tail protein [Volucribacter amazonae]MDG6894527.1 phage tail protein [Volucribacter amazonae]
MSVKVTGLEQLQANAQQLVKQQLPNAVAKSLNKIAKNARKKAIKQVAAHIGVPVRTLQGRVRSQSAKRRQPVAKMRVNRMDMPLIRLLERPRNKIWVGKGGIIVGKYAVERGFKQKLKNGRQHIMQRVGKARYPIDVVKIPLSTPLTNAFHQQLKDYPAQVQNELRQQLQFILGK